jgi:hypothetical protein
MTATIIRFPLPWNACVDCGGELTRDKHYRPDHKRYSVPASCKHCDDTLCEACASKGGAFNCRNCGEASNAVFDLVPPF